MILLPVLAPLCPSTSCKYLYSLWYCQQESTPLSPSPPCQNSLSCRNFQDPLPSPVFFEVTFFPPQKKRVCRCGQVKSKDIYWATMLGAWSEYDQSLSLSQPPPPPNIPLCLLFSLSWFHLKEIFFFRVISFKDNWSGWLSPDLF